jgi:hypothetical protein
MLGPVQSPTVPASPSAPREVEPAGDAGLNAPRRGVGGHPEAGAGRINLDPLDQLCLIVVAEIATRVEAHHRHVTVEGACKFAAGPTDLAGQAVVCQRLTRLRLAGLLEASPMDADWQSPWLYSVRVSDAGYAALVRSMSGSPLADAITAVVPDGPEHAARTQPPPVVLGQGDYTRGIDLTA